MWLWIGRPSDLAAAAKARRSSSVQRCGPAGASTTWTRPSRRSQSFTSRLSKSRIAFSPGGVRSSRSRSVLGMSLSRYGIVWVKGRFQIIGAAPTRRPAST
jgi:hypothetical protein